MHVVRSDGVRCEVGGVRCEVCLAHVSEEMWNQSSICEFVCFFLHVRLKSGGVNSGGVTLSGQGKFHHYGAEV